jgi:transposase
LGEDVKKEYLNDDKIGRVMDKLYKYGLNNLFIEIGLSVINKFKIDTKYSHLDATSFHLHGEDNQEKESEITRERPIIITKGYSRDHRPDLKQCVLDLITSSDGDIPLLMRAGDGNEADKAVFGKILVEFKKQISFDSIMVCDSALYSQENLKLIEHLKWISRVPMTIKKAQELVQSVEIEEINLEEIERRAALNLDGYKWKSEIVSYGGIKQTWLIVESQKRKDSDLDKLDKKLKKEKHKVEKLLKELKKENEELGKQSQARQEIEIKLGRQIIRAYELPTKIVRTDTTSFSVNHEKQSDTEENLLRYGYSKDKRPDLLQYRQLLATLDPMGMPLVSATLKGNGADDPLYFPTWQKIQKVIGHKNFVFIADCKAGSIATRANIAANRGIYCVPLPMSGQNPQFLKQWVLEPPTESIDIRLPRQSEQEVAVGRGFEVELGKFWFNPETIEEEFRSQNSGVRINQSGIQRKVRSWGLPRRRMREAL